MDNGNVIYLLVAYAVTWLGIFGYLFVLNRSANRLREELAALTAATRQADER